MLKEAEGEMVVTDGMAFGNTVYLKRLHGNLDELTGHSYIVGVTSLACDSIFHN